MNTTAWIAFLGLVAVMLALDLGLLHRKAHTVSFREALIGACIPVFLALAFNVLIFYGYDHHWLGLGDVKINPHATESGKEAALEFFTGYLVELSLSADNVFLFVLLLSHFRVPTQYQHRVLFWGVLGALVMRAVMILAGAALIDRFHGILYFFGALLIFTGVKMFFSGDAHGDPSQGRIVRTLRKIMPLTDEFHGQKFFIRRENKGWAATPLFLVLMVIELTDVVFAVDSIPAVFAITDDPFLVFTSNVFAVLGLRSMYFLLAGVMDKFHYLKTGLAIVLAFVGVKMLLPLVGDKFADGAHWHVPTPISLAVIALTLGGSVAASLLWPKKKAH